jgi:hypothetical protein
MKMNSEMFTVSVNEDTVAEFMPLQYALILTKAIYSEFYAEPNLKVTIEKMQLEERYTGEVVDDTAK